MHAIALGRRLALFVLIVGGVISTRAQAEVTAEKTDDKVTIKIDGKLFCEYLTNSGGKPIVWPIIGPGGAEMTRSYPMKKKSKGKQTDHVHHRSLWFTHGDVNGVDFWLEGSRGGKQVHREFVRVEGGDRATIVTRNDWVSPAGEKVCDDERRLAFFADGDNARDRLRHHDERSGQAAGVRRHQGRHLRHPRRRVDARRTQKGPPASATSPTAKAKPTAPLGASAPPGSIITGLCISTDKSQPTLGIAILNHPSSFRHPTHWHVRTYGLFAANPFGIHDFETKKDAECRPA